MHRNYKGLNGCIKVKIDNIMGNRVNIVNNSSFEALFYTGLIKIFR